MLPISDLGLPMAATSCLLARCRASMSFILLMQNYGGGVTFQVAEYRKPEIDLDLGFDRQDVLAGDQLNVEITSRYFSMRLRLAVRSAGICMPGTGTSRCRAIMSGRRADSIIPFGSQVTRNWVSTCLGGTA